MEVIRLKAGQTMGQYRHVKRQEDEAAAIVAYVKANPGVESVALIGDGIGLDARRVRGILRKVINERGSSYAPVGYGTADVDGIPTTGWFLVNKKGHHVVMDQQDEHLSRIERGVRRRRLVNIELTELAVRHSEATVEKMIARLALDREQLTTADVEAIDELIREEVEVG